MGAQGQVPSMAVVRRVLCLHGNGLNGAFFRRQLGRLHRLAPDTEFVYLDGHLPTSVPLEAVGAWRAALPPKDRFARQYYKMRNESGTWKVEDIGSGLEHTWEAVRAEVA